MYFCLAAMIAESVSRPILVFGRDRYLVCYTLSRNATAMLEYLRRAFVIQFKDSPATLEVKSINFICLNEVPRYN